MGGLVADGHGRLYGTTSNFDAGGGAVFMVGPSTPLTVIHKFSSLENYLQGYGAEATLTLAPDGTLYGTTVSGGVNGSTGGGGVIFSLSPPPPGSTAWTYKVLYDFSNDLTGPSGSDPAGRLYRDGSGVLYGATVYGGASGSGVIYSLTPPAPGNRAWTYRTLYQFAGGQDGFYPEAGVIPGSAGVLYGTTAYGGTKGSRFCCGSAFQLSPPAAGTSAWTKTTLHAFSGDSDGSTPGRELALDASGSLYGTAPESGPAGGGTAFALSPPAQAGGVWDYKLLFAFSGPGTTATGNFPSSPLLPDGSGGFLGTTSGGGTGNGGTLFRLSPPAPGQTLWSETILHAFRQVSGPADGNDPVSDLVLTKRGLVLGVTQTGTGADLLGTLYKIHP